MPWVNDKLVKLDQPALFCAHETRRQLVGADKGTFNVCGPSARMVAGRASAYADVSFLRTPARSDHQRHPQFVAHLLQGEGDKRQAAFIKHLHWVAFECCRFLRFDKFREGKIARQHLADARRGEARLRYAIVICVGHLKALQFEFPVQFAALRYALRYPLTFRVMSAYPFGHVGLGISNYDHADWLKHFLNSLKNGSCCCGGTFPRTSMVPAKPAGGRGQGGGADAANEVSESRPLDACGAARPLINIRDESPGDGYAWATAQAGLRKPGAPLANEMFPAILVKIRGQLCIVLATEGRALVSICTTDTALAGRAY